METSSNETSSEDGSCSKRVAIIGAGAAGYFAAITAAELDPTASVEIFEASRRSLSKVAVSGGGRCNVTHHCFEPQRLVNFYPRGGKELRGAFHIWQPSDTVEWFRSRKVELKTEADGRMFPVTDNSQTIIDCLSESATKAGVKLHLKCGVQGIAWDASSGFKLSLSTGETISITHLVIATGGSQNNKGHQFASKLGHRITQLAPSLFTFHIEDPILKDLQGVSLANVTVSYPPAKLSQSGPVVFTHWGLSGPGILKLSAWGARVFRDLDYRCELLVNWLGEKGLESTRATLEESKSQYAKKAISNANPFDLPKRFWERLLSLNEIPPETQWAQLSKRSINQLAEKLTRTPLATHGKSMNKEEFVTCGGIFLKEVDFKSMQSRLVPQLYFAGEVLDIDGVTGGFNFQAAWTTGRIAGTSIAVM